MKEIKKSLTSLGKHFSFFSTSDLIRGSRITQSGRSMVEILGVLAIIGVLSIGGIAGYNYGMNQYRANETINDVNMRMIDVMNQVYQNKSEIAIPEDWDLKGRSGYVIDVFQNKTFEPSIMVEDVPTGVCKEILKSTPDTQDIFVGVKNGEEVDGNWYLGNNENICDGGNKEMLFALSPEVLASFNPDTNTDELEGTATIVVTAQECYSNADCHVDKPFCENGTCIQCSEDSHCPNENPYCDTAKGICHECVSNEDCDAGQFCADSNESDSKATPYTCKTLNFSSIDLTNEEGITETWYYSNEQMSWWDTKMACEAMVSRMAKFLDLSTGEQKEGWPTGYRTIRPHVTQLYNIVDTTIDTNPAMPYFAVNDSWRFVLLKDGFIPNSRPRNTIFVGYSPLFGICIK